MPYKDPGKQRAAKRSSAARIRRAARLSLVPSGGAEGSLPLDGDPAEQLEQWSRRTLKIPAGHPLAGAPMELPRFGVEFLRDALRHRQSLLCMARKNAKSAIIAVMLLGFLDGPLKLKGWRAGVASVNKEKAGELKAQMEGIAIASGLIRGVPEDRIRFLRSPAPGRVVSRYTGGTVDILSADKSSGHASGFDLAIVDELGLMKEANRGLVNGLRSSVSAKDGRFLALSIRGDAPFTQEMIDGRDSATSAVHLYDAPASCELNDRAAWQAANPGLGTIKSLSYMEDEAARVLTVPADQSSFRAFDLNQRLDPSREMICSVAEWTRVVSSSPPGAGGPVVIGIDLGGSASMTAACIWWLQTGLIEVYGAFPETPNLADRGFADGVGGRYELMKGAGELRTYPGLVTPVGQFIQFLAHRVAGCQVVRAGADRYRQAEMLQALNDAKVSWPMVWRGQGAAPTADGSADVRAFQRAVLGETFRCRPSLLMESAIADSAVRRDELGNPGLSKSRARGRIDSLSAAVIAAGLAERIKAVELPRVAVV